MSREVKRVPLGFDWPLGQVWWGYTYMDAMPAGLPCGTCRGTGAVAYKTKHSVDVRGGWWCPLCYGDREVLVPRIEPPDGDGWQLWETVSEGSPVTPVFATPEELAAWLAEPGNDDSVTRGTTYEQWLAMIRAGWCPTAVGHSGGGFVPGPYMHRTPGYAETRHASADDLSSLRPFVRRTVEGAWQTGGCSVTVIPTSDHDELVLISDRESNRIGLARAPYFSSYDLEESTPPAEVHWIVFSQALPELALALFNHAQQARP